MGGTGTGKVVPTLSPPVAVRFYGTFSNSIVEITIPGSTEIVAWVGASGKALVTASVLLSVPASVTATLAVNVNGTLGPWDIAAQNLSAAGPFAISTSRSVIVAAANGVVPNAYNTFGVWAALSSAGAGAVNDGTLIVQPL